MSNLQTCSSVLLRLLDLENINKVFGYPGGAVIPLYDAIFLQDKVKHYLVRHEQAAAHAAEAYGKVNKSIGCCFATSGPGATNLISGITNAYMDSNPLLCITGQVNKAAIGKMSFQEVDIVSISKPVTKKSIQLQDAQDLVEVLFELIRLALDGRCGPVLLDIPKDVLIQKIDGEQAVETYTRMLNEYTKPEYKQNKEDIDLVLKMLKESKKPVFLVGAGIIKADAEKEVRRIVEFFKIPVVTSLHGLGICSKTKYYYGMAGMHGSVIANKALYNADLVVSLGSRFDDRLVGNNKKFVKHGKKIHIDIDSNELGKNVKTNLKINTDLKAFLSELSNHYLEIDAQSWILQLNQFKKEINEKKNDYDYDNELHPKQLFDVINKTKASKLFVTDVGQHQMWSAQYLKLDHGNQIISSGGSGTMGFGLPASIGASIACPEKSTVLFVGDGGIQMTSEELLLLSQYNLNVKVFILNNQRLGMVRQWQKLFCDKRYSSTVLDYNPDFEFLAKAYHLDYVKVNNKHELDVIDKVFSTNKAMVIEVMIDSDAQVLPMIPANESFEEIII